MTEGKYNFWGAVIVAITTAFDWAASEKFRQAWFLPIGLSVLALWLLAKQERGFQELGREIRSIVRNRAKRKIVRQALVHVAGRAALIGVIGFWIWSNANHWYAGYAVQRLSPLAVEYYQAQCFGMRGSLLTRAPYDVDPKHLPSLSKLSVDGQRQHIRMIIAELGENGILRKVAPERIVDPIRGEGDKYTLFPTKFGERVCEYFWLNPPKITPPKTQ